MHRRRVLAQTSAIALASFVAMAHAQVQPPARSEARGDILVGRSTALSGGMAPFLQPIHEGQDAAIAHANASGGIGGRKIRLVTLDDGFDPGRALDNTRQLAER